MYSYEDVFNESIKFFNGDELATDVFIKKYALRDFNRNLLEKSPIDMFKRISKELSRIENKKFKNPLTEEEIFNLLKEMIIVPQGSPLAGIGNNYSFQTLGNCYVLDNVQDSYGGIFYSDQQLGQLMKRRAGVGIDISNIRPKGLPVKNSAGTTDGIAVFMDRFSNTCREVAQGGRRGALLISIDVHHPEVSTFINIKRDLKRVTGANISVKLTDDFLNAVENNEDYEQYWPIDNKKEKKISKKVKARVIWKEIIESAWASGEPGILFWDTMINNSLSNRYGEINPLFYDKTTNPCFTKDTIIAVADGRNGVDIKTLAESNSKFPVYCARKSYYGYKGSKSSFKKWKTEVKNAIAFKTGTKEIINIYLSNGDVIKCTENHKLALKNGEYIEAKDSIGSILEGFFTFISEDGKKHRYINSYTNGYSKQHRYIWEFYNGKKPEGFAIDHKINNGSDEIDNLQLLNISEHDKKSGYERLSKDNGIFLIKDDPIYRNNLSHSTFLQKNGGYCGLSNLDLIKIGREVLKLNKNINVQNCRQINSKFPKTFSKNRFNGSFKEFKEIVEGIREYVEPKCVDFIKREDKLKKNEEISVIKVEYTGKFEDVYDLTVEDNHNFYIITSTEDKDYKNCKGILVHNCGEIIMGVDSCRLMIVALHKFVENPFTEKAKFNYEKFDKIVQMAQRLMDDLIDIEIECIDKIIKKVKKDPEPENIKQIELKLWEELKNTCVEGRRTGLGVNSLADTLAGLNIKYGSDESLKIVDKIFKTFAVSSLKSSCLMAKELGTFPIYNKELENKYPNKLLDRIFTISPEVKDLHNKYGRRNISLTTCSPTGSISLLTQTSSGIEPLFTMEPYIRRKKINPEDKNERVDFIDGSGDKWQEYKVFHPYLKKWMKITGKTDLKKSPYFNATADSIDWEKSIKIQSIIQKWITHSISKTVNVPNNISKDITEKVYLAAWKENCKGITFYRDGSRSGVLVKEDNNIQINSKKRPKELECEIFYINISKKLDKIRSFQYLVVVGKLNNRPYEIFAIENNFIKNKINKGKIIKHHKGNYDLIFEDNTIIKNITKETTENEDSLTRMVSLSLRHGIPLQYIVEQLLKVEGEMFCFAKSISRTLKKYIKNGTKSTEICPDCQIKMEFENGCFICKNCGFSRCG